MKMILLYVQEMADAALLAAIFSRRADLVAEAIRNGAEDLGNALMFAAESGDLEAVKILGHRNARCDLAAAMITDSDDVLHYLVTSPKMAVSMLLNDNRRNLDRIKWLASVAGEVIRPVLNRLLFEASTVPIAEFYTSLGANNIEDCFVHAAVSGRTVLMQFYYEKGAHDFRQLFKTLETSGTAESRAYARTLWTNHPTRIPLDDSIEPMRKP
jgi:hypothetical protein